MNLNPSEPIDFKSIQKCRDIHQEIIKFGVNDSEIIKLIELLSLELENSNMMREIMSIIKPDENSDLQKKESLIL
jgi:hypothetical protein